MNRPRLINYIQNGVRCFAKGPPMKRAGQFKPLKVQKKCSRPIVQARKLPTMPHPRKKGKKVCRYVFPYPKCIDLFSLRPEPHCIAAKGKCNPGSSLVLFLGLLSLGAGAFMSYVTPVKMLFYSCEDDDDDY